MSDYVLELQKDLLKTRKLNRLYEMMTFGILLLGNLLAFTFAALMMYKAWIG